MVRLRLLGETAIDVDGTPVGPESQVLFAVLLVLALERGKRIARPALHRLLWPGADEESGRHNLRQVLYKLRQLGTPLDATQGSVMLPASEVGGELVELMSDVRVIGARLLAGRRVGELLPGYAPTFSAAFADWIDEQRALLHAQLRRALLGALADARTLGQWREVEAIAREVLRFDPLNEEATLALAESTALAGAKAQAIEIIDRYLDEIGGRGTDLRLPATVLRRRIAERFPAHRYVSAADACFVGRAAEMAELLRLWHRARERRGGAALLWGEPGIGKTRLAHELGKVAVLQGAQVQRVASRSWDAQRPLGAVVDLVPSLRELPGAAGVDPSCHAYLDRLTKHDPTRTLADLPDPATLHRQVRQAVFDLVEAVLAEAPLVLVFEDVQWLDASSWEVLAELLRLARTRRLLLVLTSRVLAPPHLPESEDWEALRCLRLGGLDTAATHELLDAMTREAGRYIDPDYREWCVPLANGNPLHVQEIALQWLEKGSVREAPGSLRAMVEARLRSLSAPALMALRTSTLAGTEASPSLIAQATGDQAGVVIGAIQQLEGEGLVQFRAGTLHVRHDVIAEQVMSGMEPGATSLLRDRIATGLFTDSVREGKPELLWECYHHWALAGQWKKANRALLPFCDHILASGHAEECESLLLSALTLCKDPGSQQQLRSKLAMVASLLGHWQQVASLPAHSTTDESTIDALLRLYEARWHSGADVTVLKLDALALARRRFLPPTSRVRAAIWALIFAENAGHSNCVAELDSSVVPLLPGLGRARIHGLHYEVIAGTQRGDITGVGTAAAEMLLLARSERDSVDTLRIFRHAAHGLELAGDLASAEDALLAAMEVCFRIAATSALASCQEALAQLKLYQHDAEATRHWATLAAVSFSKTDDQHGGQAVSFIRLQADVAESRIDDSLAALTVLGVPEAGDTNYSRHIARVSAHLRVAAALCSPVDALQNQARECQALLRRKWSSGSSDFVAAAVAHAHCSVGNTIEARSFLREYYTSIRLRRGAPHLDLLRAEERAGFEHGRQ